MDIPLALERNRLRAAGFAIGLALMLVLAGCGQRASADRNLDTLDNELVDGNGANMRDPALMSALQDQIMVDPTLAAQANHDALQPPAQPYSGALPPDGIAGNAAARDTGANEPLKSAPAPRDGDCPGCAAARASLTLGALAARQKDARTSSCARDMHYSTRWAQRLPADLPLYPDARLAEAAGNDAAGCALRAVSFSSAAPLDRVIDWYYTRASEAGYSAEHQADANEHVLAGTRDRDDAAYAIFLTKRAGGGTDVDLVANNGR